MDVDDSVNDWSSDDDAERQLVRSAPCQRSQLRPARKTLPFVPYPDWDPGQSYEAQPPFCMHYIMEWKLTVNKRVAAKQTEDDLVVAPSDFWNEELSSTIADIVKSTGKPCKADATTVVISVNDRSERDITKRFKELKIDWPVVERQLQTWSHLLRIGKTLRIHVSFNYVESGKTARTAGRGATATQLAERNIRLDAEQVVSGGPDAWRQIYNLLRCPGPPCDRGPYCWQDIATKKHYKLMGHHLRGLVKFVQQGGKLETHGDVPEDIRTQLYAEEQQYSDRKRKRRDSGSHPTAHLPMIINNYIPALADRSRSALALPDSFSSQPSPLTIPGLRDDAVAAYCEWHCSKIRSQDQKEQYKLIRELALEKGFDLELIHEDHDAQFYIERGVLEGVARRWVKDVKVFLDQYDAL
ncbi:hypothetical protein QBC46DRAFT_83014 [Diplogelasinospora grovesii]|uniref:Uncharacterized protein n=1 Tax=Diplogelasinospora grovesii TaxID=303347 RepID=A0AAN6MXJ5_9PEZI|nr:hypothetical protein QBC46DRAFT_83014 [Diplogelasinospora grovesii]